MCYVYIGAKCGKGHNPVTLNELSRLFLLRKRRAELHGRLEELRAASTGITSPRLDGMPRSPSRHESKVERFVIGIVDTDRSIIELDLEILRAEIDIQRFVSTVPDSRMRLILQYRFVDCLTWRDVARALNDGKTTESDAKITISRFLRSEGKRDADTH